MNLKGALSFTILFGVTHCPPLPVGSKEGRIAVQYRARGDGSMGSVDIICTVIVFALCAFVMVGIFILQRDKYWNRIWKRLGEPDVESIKELKAFKEKRDQAKRSGKD